MKFLGLMMVAGVAMTATGEAPVTLVKETVKPVALAQVVEDPEQPSFVVRRRAVDVVPEALVKMTGMRVQAAEPQRVVLALFPDAVYTAAVERVESNRFGVTTAWGRLEGEGRELSRVILSAAEGMLLAEVHPMDAPGRVFNVQFHKTQETHEAIETNLAAMPPMTDGVLIPPKEAP